MLVYHFATRDELLRAVLRCARERQLAAFGELLEVRPNEPYPATVARAWAEMTGPLGRPFLAMFGRLRGDAEPAALMRLPPHPAPTPRSRLPREHERKREGA